MRVAGEGARLAKIAKLRQTLLAGGLFEAERKVTLAVLPRSIGVVTWSRGAVLPDIVTTIAGRWPSEVSGWRVAVQGEDAANQITEAIKGFSVLTQRPDLLIVARGGGSLEDLMAFNDERVVRAVAACPIPLISAVGHETDTTLIDFASDRRAPTPTAAAEMAVPLRSEMVADLQHRNARLTGASTRHVQIASAALTQVAARLPDLPNLVETLRLRLDERSQRLELAVVAANKRAHHQISALASRQPSIPHFIAMKHTCLVLAETNLHANLRHRLQATHTQLIQRRLTQEIFERRFRYDRAQLSGVAGRLQSVSPLAVLARGYTLVQDTKGATVSSSEALATGGAVSIRFVDGLRHGRLDPVGTSTTQGDLGL